MTDAATSATDTQTSKATSTAPRKRPAISAAKSATKSAPVARKERPAAKAVVVAKKAVPKAPAAKVAKTAAVKPRAKLVRDSFTMPQADFDLVAALKQRLIGLGRSTKKSELLRAGLQQLATLSDVRLTLALAALVPIKTGRPKKD